MKRVLVLLAIATVAAMAPVQAQPLTVSATAAQSGGAWIARQTVVANSVTGYDNWNVGVSNIFGANNSNGSPTTVADFKANAMYDGCTWVPTFNCTSWYAPQQNVSPTAYQADVIGNTATISMTLLDTASVSHQITLTFTRPLYTNYGVNAPNVWADAATGSGQVGIPTVGLARQGYTVTGTIDNLAVVNNTNCSPSGICGWANGQTWTQAGPGAVTVNG